MLHKPFIHKLFFYHYIRFRYNDARIVYVHNVLLYLLKIYVSVRKKYNPPNLSFCQKNHFSPGHKFAFQNFWFPKKKEIILWRQKRREKSKCSRGCQDCGEKLVKKKIGMKPASGLWVWISYIVYYNKGVQTFLIRPNLKIIFYLVPHFPKSVTHFFFFLMFIDFVKICLNWL